MPSTPRLMIIDSDCPQKWWALHYLADQLILQQSAIDAAQKYLDLANARIRTGLGGANIFA